MAIHDHSGRLHQPHYLTHSDPPIMSTDALVRKPRSSYSARNHTSDEYHATSRFVEAMRNPNWRKRRTDDESFTTTCTEESSYRPTAFKKPRTGNGSSDESVLAPKPRVICNSMETPFAATVGRAPPSEAEVEEGRGARELFAGSVKHEETTEMCNTTGFCEVLRHVDFPDFRSGCKQPSILELAPISSDLSYPPQLHGEMSVGRPPRKIVEIRPFEPPVNLKTRAAYSAQDEQIAATLRATDTTPEKIKAFSFATRYARAKSPSFEAGKIFKAREAVLNDPAVAQIGNSAKPSKFENRQVGSEVHGNQEDPKHVAYGSGRDIAFRKMIQRLQNGASQESKPSSQIEDRISLPDQDFSMAIKNAPCRGATQQPEAKAGAASSKQSPHSDSSHDSAVSLQNLSKSGTWNPRAREFLSLTEDHMIPLEEAVHPRPSPGVPLNAMLFNLDGNLNQGHADMGTDKSLGKGTSLPEPFPVLIPHLSHIAFNGANNMPETSMPAAGSAILPVTEALYQHGSYPGATSPPFLTLGLGGSLPPDALNPTQLGHPPSCEVRTLPPIGSYRQSPGATPWDGVQSSVNVPLAVPKPRKPDPRDQQAYEAWIEWRKANEPGYAMECKLRQQRRAQKHRTTKPNSDSKKNTAEVESCA